MARRPANTVVETPNFIVTVVFHPTDASNRDWQKTVRVYSDYIAGKLGVDAPESYDDNPENNKLWRAFNKEEVAAQRENIELAILELATGPNLEDWAAAALLKELVDSGLRFSRKAGCSCPCSPGFVSGTGKTLVAGRVEQVSVECRRVSLRRRTTRAPRLTGTMADFALVAN